MYSKGGVNPDARIYEIAQQLDELQTRDEIETALDEVEYLFEVIPPEMQDPAEQLIGLLRARLAEADS